MEPLINSKSSENVVSSDYSEFVNQNKSNILSVLDRLLIIAEHLVEKAPSRIPSEVISKLKAAICSKDIKGLTFQLHSYPSEYSEEPDIRTLYWHWIEASVHYLEAVDKSPPILLKNDRQKGLEIAEQELKLIN